MINTNLPKTYAGYSVDELLDMWGGGSPLRIPEGTPKPKIIAMRGLLRDYKIAGIFWDDVSKFEENKAGLRKIFADRGIKLNDWRDHIDQVCY